jgi:hypothetical protein
MVPLEHDGTGVTFVGIQRSACNSRNFLVIHHRFPVEYDRHAASDQGDVIGLPFSGRFGGILGRGQEPVNTADRSAVGFLAVAILNLNFVPTPQVDTTVAVFGVVELDVENPWQCCSERHPSSVPRFVLRPASAASSDPRAFR